MHCVGLNIIEAEPSALSDVACSRLYSVNTGEHTDRWRCRTIAIATPALGTGSTAAICKQDGGALASSPSGRGSFQLRIEFSGRALEWAWFNVLAASWLSLVKMIVYSSEGTRVVISITTISSSYADKPARRVYKSVNVTQHSTIRYGFLSMFYNNFVPHRFQDIYIFDFKNAVTWKTIRQGN